MVLSPEKTSRDPKGPFLGTKIFVKKISIFFAVVLLSIALPAYAKGKKLELGKYMLRNVHPILAKAASKHPDMVEACKSSYLTEDEIRQYFKKATIHEEPSFMHDSDWTDCYIAGEIVKGDEILRWQIYGLKNAIFFIPGKEDENYLSCPECKAAFFRVFGDD